MTNSDRAKLVNRPYIRWLVWGGAISLTATISATLGATLALMSPLSSFIIPDNPLFGGKDKSLSQSFPYNIARPVNILVMGIDRVPDVPKSSPEIFSGRSDTILLLRLDPKEKSVTLLSIPRDTQIEIPGIGIDKINDANVKGGATQAAKVVSQTLNNIQIDRYVRITTDAFRELVDLVGGVEVFVPEPMEYTDITQKLHIDLNQGWQTLNGDQAEQFARFRNNNKGDIGRVQRQQILLKALRQRLTSSAVLPRLPQAIRVMQQYIDTNLTLEEILAIVSFSLNLQPDDLKMVLLPGRFSTPKEFIASYWIVDKEGKNRIVQDHFQKKPDFPSANTHPSPKQLRIAIQNATDNPEIANRISQYLTQKEFHNIYIVKDWPDRLSETEIIVQQGDLKAATSLKKILGIGKIEPSSIGELKSDLTIRIGEDWLNRDIPTSQN
ncbi:LCP family protein [Limnofasciculus baicalensis]|uniref:LCP family protein n=1 Tax=Limnofasciculus baicalensis BBK-W-15 TaxID=2699891 RepID=A0AAE3KLP9_9CYAN|nr:LCP family protein [Limnofasciculus baicalensis]MCP2728760.1 LCP family protein [Limnofasciculus baicalensis BBK-W-15]